MAAVNRRRQLLLLLLLRRRRRQKRMWVRKIFQSRSKKGEFHALLAEMTLVDHEFYKYFHMTPQRFSQLLSCVGPFIKRQNTRLREAIPPDERLIFFFLIFFFFIYFFFNEKKTFFLMHNIQSLNEYKKWGGGGVT